MNDMPTLALPDRPNFMVADGKTYLLEKVGHSPDDMLKLIEQYYDENIKEMKNRVTNHVSRENQIDLEAQMSRIERHLNMGIVTIPDYLRGNGVILQLYANKVYDTRIVLFRPNRISVTLRMIRDYLQYLHRDITRKEAERYSRFVEWAKPLVEQYMALGQDITGIKVDISLEQDLFLEAMVASYLPSEGIIHVRPDNLHPHVHRGGKLCTGGSDPQMFWDDPQFKSNFNMLNPHSWAHQDVPCAQYHKQLLKNQYFVEGRVRVAEGAWRI